MGRFPSLCEETKLELKWDFNEEELTRSVKGLDSLKSPGADGNIQPIGMESGWSFSYHFCTVGP